MIWKRLFVLLWLCGCSSGHNDGRPDGPVGAASFELSEVTAPGIAVTPFVAEELSLTLAQRCFGGFPRDTCLTTLTIEAKRGERRVQMSQLRNDAIVGKPFTLSTRNVLPEPEWQEPGAAGQLRWSPPSPSTNPLPITMEVAENGQVTYRFDRVPMADRKHYGETAVLTGVLVLDGCVLVEAGTAQCYPRSGEARP